MEILSEPETNPSVCISEACSNKLPEHMEGVEETKSYNRKRSFKDANAETSNKHSKTYCQPSSTHNTNKNAEKQRRYMERL